MYILHRGSNLYGDFKCLLMLWVEQQQQQQTTRMSGKATEFFPNFEMFQKSVD